MNSIPIVVEPFFRAVDQSSVNNETHTDCGQTVFQGIPPPNLFNAMTSHPDWGHTTTGETNTNYSNFETLNSIFDDFAQMSFSKLCFRRGFFAHCRARVFLSNHCFLKAYFGSLLLPPPMMILFYLFGLLKTFLVCIDRSMFDD